MNETSQMNIRTFYRVYTVGSICSKRNFRKNVIVVSVEKRLIVFV